MSGSTYYVPEQSKWPILASIALGLLAYGAAMTLTVDGGRIEIQLAPGFLEFRIPGADFT